MEAAAGDVKTIGTVLHCAGNGRISKVVVTTSQAPQAVQQANHEALIMRQLAGK